MAGYAPRRIRRPLYRDERALVVAWRALAVAAAVLFLGLNYLAEASESKVVKLVASEDMITILQVQLDSFMAANPDIEVQTQAAATLSTTDLASTVKALLLQQSDHMDVFAMDVIWPGDLAELTINLFDYLDEDTVRSQFFEGIIDNNMVDGKLVALPWYHNLGTLYYRADLLAKYGFSGPPRTWAQLRNMSYVIMEGEQGQMWGYATQMDAYEGLVCNVVEWFQSWGGGMVVEPDGTVSLNNARAKASVEFFRDAIGDWISPQCLSYKEAETLAAFERGNAVFARHWPGTTSTLKASTMLTEAQWNATALPGFVEDSSFGCLGGWGWGIAAHTPHKEESVRLIEWITSYDAQMYMGTVQTRMPTRKELYVQEEICANVPCEIALLTKPAPRPSTPTAPNYLSVSRTLFNGVAEMLARDKELDAGFLDMERAVRRSLGLPPRAFLLEDDSSNTVTIAVACSIGGVLILMAAAFLTVYRRNYAKIAAQLDEMKKLNDSELNLESPLTKAILAARGLRAKMAGKEEVGAQLDLIIRTLLMSKNSSNHNPDLDKNTEAMDTNTNTYLRQLLNHQVRQRNGPKGNAEGSNISVVSRSSNYSGSRTSNNVRRQSLAGAAMRADATISRHVVHDEVDVEPASVSAAATAYMQKLATSWDTFDIFRVANLTDGHPLAALGDFLFTERRTYSELSLDRPTVLRWLAEMEHLYHTTNPYHNSTHAADVLHAVNVLISHDAVKNFFSPSDIFSVLVAAIIHDVDHPALTNNFLTNTRHELAILYNDKAPLENHHVATMFSRTLSNEAINMFADMAVERFKGLRKTIVECVLATDVSQHFFYLEAFKNRTALTPLTPDDPDNSLLLLQLIVKMGDVSNPAKPAGLAKTWTSRIMEEFFAQGDAEREAGLPVSMFMDRESTDVSKCQTGFILFIVKPLYSALDNMMALPGPMGNIHANMEFWNGQGELSKSKQEARDGSARSISSA